jgi:class 3 adenylate cyclase
MRGFRFNFRSKLLLAMMAVVVGVTGATLYVTQNKVQATYSALFEQQSKAEVQFFNTLQQARLNPIKDRCRVFGRSVRLRSNIRAVNDAVDSNDRQYLPEALENLYKTAEDELRDILRASGESKTKAAFFRFLDARGHPLAAAKGVDAGLTRGPGHDELNVALTRLGEAVADEAEQRVGLIPATMAGHRELLEVVFTKILDRASGESIGALVLGFPVPFSAQKQTQLSSGLWVNGEIYSGNIPMELRPRFAEAIGNSLRNENTLSGDLPIAGESGPWRVFFEKLPVGAVFPVACQVAPWSLEQALSEQRDLQRKILGFGGTALLGALAMSLFLSRGLTAPIHELVRGTEEIQRGNYEIKVPVRTRDEIGQLSVSFNEMADGLALKEKYRSVLNVVADKAVAQDLINGNITLGGEVREVSVLFCDIRGFTALTQNMDPAEVIQMLNEHMTLLTRVVYEHHGVVDKFVGDLIMALFGAPKSYGNDAVNGASCALQMIRQRRELNTTSKYNIEMGIGLATGRVVAGRMGSQDRLNYTVLGERVNLAARLCSKAGRMEVVIDQATRERLGDTATVNELPALELKGFSDPVPAYKLTGFRTESVVPA